MQYPIGEICDRYTILSIKMRKFPNLKTKRELDIFKEEIDKIVLKYPKSFQILIGQLYKWNLRIWSLEADIRLGEIDHDLEEIGRRTIKIREYNKLRVETKNEINFLTGFNQYIEVKSTWTEKTI